MQRLEKTAVDIAVGIKVLAAARKEDSLRREEEARQREEERQRRERVFRQKHIDERRSKALDSLLEEMASLDRLRRLVSSLRAELEADASRRVAVLVTFAEEKLARRELALSADCLERRFEESRCLPRTTITTFGRQPIIDAIPQKLTLTVPTSAR